MLTNTKSATNPDESYTWDAVGNRLTSSGSRPVFDTAISGPTPRTLHYSYGAGYKLSSDDVYNYEYDAEGNTVEKRRPAQDSVCCA